MDSEFIKKQLFTPFSPGASAAMFETEKAIMRLDYESANKRILKSMRTPLLALEAISAMRCTDPFEEEIDILQLIQVFNALKSSCGDEFFVIAESECKPTAFADLSVTAKHAFYYMCALSWIARNIHASTRIDHEVIRCIHELCKRGYVQGGRTEGYRNDDLRPTSVTHAAHPNNIYQLINIVCAFANRPSFSPIGQSSKVHFCFEQIYPFNDYVDATGLFLAYAVLFKRGLVASEMVFPFSWRGAASKSFRQAVLHPYAHSDHCQNESMMGALNQWALFNSNNSLSAVKVANVFLDAMTALNAKWRNKLQKTTAGSSTDELLYLLLGTPRITVREACTSLRKSFSAVNEAFAKLERAGIVRSIQINNRDREFIATQSASLISLLTNRLIELYPSDPQIPKEQVRHVQRPEA